MTWLLLAAVFVLPGVLALAAVMLSSRLTREEEVRK